MRAIYIVTLFLAVGVAYCLANEENDNNNEASFEDDIDEADQVEKRFSSQMLMDNLRHAVGKTNKRSFSTQVLYDNLRHMTNTNSRTKRSFSSQMLMDNLRHAVSNNNKSKRFSSQMLYDNLRHIAGNNAQASSRQQSSNAMTKRFSSQMLIDNLRQALAAGQAGGAVIIRPYRDAKRFLLVDDSDYALE